jgi:hypothetical protein
MRYGPGLHHVPLWPAWDRRDVAAWLSTRPETPKVLADRPADPGGLCLLIVVERLVNSGEIPGHRVLGRV